LNLKITRKFCNKHIKGAKYVIAVAEHFLSEVVKESGQHPVST
jgi:hypothetical protein